MMFSIKSIYIKNFKAYEKETILVHSNSLILGENDSGKSTILEALDLFFNGEKVEKVFVRDPEIDVEIGILVSNNGELKFIKKIYSSKAFKLSEVSGDASVLDLVSYVFVPCETPDVKKLISDLAAAKTVQELSDETKNEIKAKMQSSVNQVLGTIDGELLVVKTGNTELSSKTNLKLDGAFKFDILSNGIPLEGRGSGFKKTVVYSLLTKSEYENVIIGIDEIENSLSLSNACELIRIINQKFLQSFITTHSTAVVACFDSGSLIPIAKGDCKTLATLITKLGNVQGKEFVLVEGKTDVLWINRVLDLLGLLGQFVVIPCGGCDNIGPVSNELTSKGYLCHVIKDGDTGESDVSLSKDCIELYIPLSAFNQLLGLNAASVPETKDSFFSLAINGLKERSNDWVKNLLAENVSVFLQDGNPLIDEVKVLLGLDNN